MDTQTDADAVTQFLQNYMAAKPPMEMPYAASDAPQTTTPGNPLSRALAAAGAFAPVQPAQATPLAPPDLAKPADLNSPGMPTSASSPETPLKLSTPSDVSPGIKIPQPYKAPGTVDPATQATIDHAHQLENSKPGLDTLWSREANIQNPVLRALARAGTVGLHALNAAGSVFAPEVLAQIPGTPQHHAIQVSQAEGEANQAQARDAATTANTAAQVTADVNAAKPEEADARIAAMALHNQEMMDQRDRDEERKYAAQGFKAKRDANGQLVRDENGQVEHEFDPASPTGQKIAAKNLVDRAEIEQKKADTELKTAQAAVERAKNDPNSPAYKLAIGRLAVASTNAQAATTRAATYRNMYLKAAYNIGEDGQALPGAPQIDTGDGGLTTVGTANATTALKTIGKQAAFEDTRQVVSHLKDAGHALYAAGGSFNDPSVVAALADPHTTAQMWLQGQVKSSLTPAQRNAVIAVKAAQEGIMPLRALVGSGVSDSQVNALKQLLPDGSTPDLATFDEKMNSFDRQFNALQAGIPKLNRGGGKAAGDSGSKGGSVRVKLSGGTIVTVPPDKLAAVLAAGGKVQ